MTMHDEDALPPGDRLLVERACERLIGLAAAHTDAHNHEAFAGLFAPHGVLLRPGAAALQGPEAILVSYRQRAAHRLTRHVVSNTCFSLVSQGAASARSLVTVWVGDSRQDDGPLGRPVQQPLTLGEFDDQFERLDAGWRFVRREARFIMHVPLL